MAYGYINLLIIWLVAALVQNLPGRIKDIDLTHHLASVTIVEIPLRNEIQEERCLRNL